MADQGDVSLQVLIKSVLDATGYRMNEAEAVKLRAAVGQTAAASAAANAEDSAGTEALILKKRELMHVVNALGGQAVPELGRALSTLAYGGGAAGGIFLLVGAFELIRKYLSESVEKAKELASASADIWISTRDAANDAAKSARDFAEAMKATTDESGDVKKALESSQKVLDAMVDAQKKVLDLMEKQQLAAAAGDKAKEEEVKNRFDALKREYDLVAESLKLEQMRHDLAQRSEREGKLVENARQAERNLEAAQNDQEAASAEGRNKSRDEKALKAELNYRQGELERFRSGNRTALEAISGKSEHDILEQIAAAQKAFNAYEADADIVQKHTLAVDALTKKKDESVKQVTANNDAIKDEAQALQTGKSVLGIHRSAAAQQSAIEKVTAAGGVGASLSGGLDAIDALAHGQRLDQKGQQAYQAFRAVFDSVHGQFDRVLALEMNNAHLHSSHDARLAELETMYKNLSSRSNLPNQ